MKTMMFGDVVHSETVYVPSNRSPLVERDDRERGPSAETWRSLFLSCVGLSWLGQQHLIRIEALACGGRGGRVVARESRLEAARWPQPWVHRRAADEVVPARAQANTRRAAAAAPQRARWPAAHPTAHPRAHLRAHRRAHPLCMRAGKYTLRAPPQAHTAERRRGHDRQIETPREPPGHHLGVQARLLTTLRWGISRRGPFDIFLTTAPP